MDRTSIGSRGLNERHEDGERFPTCCLHLLPPASLTRVLSRVACEIFCLDMAFCVFLGRSPYFSAFSFRTRIPCHEKPWEAGTPSTCLHYLRDLPPQMDVATGMNKLRSMGEEEPPMLKVSDFGMFILMMGKRNVVTYQSQEQCAERCHQLFIALCCESSRKNESLSFLHICYKRCPT